MFKKFKERRALKKAICIEILETLCTICLYIYHDGHYCRNPYGEYCRSHANRLKSFSKILMEGEGNGK